MNEVEKKKIKRLIIVSCTVLVLCLVAVIGTTYAIFSRREEGETQQIAFGNFNVTFNQTGNSISLTNAYSMSDTIGQQNDPLSFTIQNNSGTTAKYQLSIEEEEGNTLSSSKLRYSLTKNSQVGTPGSLQNLILNEPQTLSANGTDTYELRIWIDENAGNEVQGLTWSGRIVVTSVQAQGELEDNVAPVLTLNGESTMNVVQNSPFTDPGIQSVSDNQDTSLSISNVQTQIEYFDGNTFSDVTNVDTSKLGVYYIYYSITDSQGNVGRIARSVNVHKENTIPPTITLVGANPYSIEVGNAYTDPGVTAVDSDNTNISQNVSSIHTLNTNVTGTYIIKYYVADKYGNIGSSVRTVNVVGLYQDDSGANYPELIEGLIPVTWNGSDWVKANTTSKWYDYDEQMWANAVTVTSASRDSYNSAGANTVISMDDIETMWVWIPRYSYTIKSGGLKIRNSDVDRFQTATITLTFTPIENGTLSFHSEFKSNAEGYGGIKINNETITDYPTNSMMSEDIVYDVFGGTQYTIALHVYQGMGRTTSDPYDRLTITNFNITSELDGEIEIINDEVYPWTITESAYGVQGYGGSTPSINTPGAIDIKFIDVDTKETGSATYSGTSPENYRTPDGFTFGEQELPGIWIAKFETSPDDSSTCFTNLEENDCNNATIDPFVKPDVYSWRDINVSNAFTVSQKLTAEGNRYGLDTNADGHMMKSSEWGLVAYLSQSRYGKYGNENYTGTNKEVYYTGDRTGCSSGKTSGIPFDDFPYIYSVEESGMGASTTGTIYGVYDMHGGRNELTMSNLASAIGGSYDSSGFSSLPDSKYYDGYTSSTASTACNGGVCYGHALSETSGWYSDSAYMVSSLRFATWMARGGGGDVSGGSGIGVFNFGSSGPVSGGPDSNNSFRLVIAPGS